MVVNIFYVLPTINLKLYEPMARRFASSYTEHPPGGSEHQVYALINGPMLANLDHIFDPLPCKCLTHDNSGKDLGAYFKAAGQVPGDLMLCLGSPIRFRMAGWLDQIVECYLACGPGLYGSWGAQQPLPHIRTTGFFCPPQLLLEYPYPVSNHTRYEIEHGPNSLTLWTQRMGLGTWQITWRGVFPMHNWHVPSNQDCLFLDQNTDRMGYQ